jgi:polysaccharide export outer membrane protein
MALALAGCLHREQAYYIVDPATGQRVPVARSYGQAAYAQAGYGQPAYAQAGSAGAAYAPPTATYGQAQATYAPAEQPVASRGLFSRSPAAAQQAYVMPQQAYTTQQQTYAAPPQSYTAAQPVYTQAQPQSTYAAPSYAAPTYVEQQQAAPARDEGRGFLQTLRRKRPNAVYAAAPQGVGASYAAAPRYNYASVNTAADTAYTLDSGDKLRVVVFGQDGLTNTYLVGADGNVNLPLIGNVPARGFTTAQLAQMVTERLKQGYVREPHVSVEVEAYRPFFILGEVTTPGQYPYVANMTAETAVAIAGGFSPRADKRKVQLSRNMPGQQIKGDVPLSYSLRPGDTIVVKERWF